MHLSIRGGWNRLAYQLHRHRFMNWTLTRWLVLALIALPLLALTGIIPGGKGALGATAIFSIAGLFTLWRTRRGGFLHFSPSDAPDFSKITPQKLPFPEKIPIFISGWFSVGGKSRYFVHENAFYQTFETRERVLMVSIARTRWLLLAQSPAAETGWWYNFFTADRIRQLERGWLHFGMHPRPALKLHLSPEKAGDAPLVFHISTETPAQMEQLIADLKVEIGGGNTNKI